MVVAHGETGATPDASPLTGASSILVSSHDWSFLGLLCACRVCEDVD